MAGGPLAEWSKEDDGERQERLDSDGHRAGALVVRRLGIAGVALGLFLQVASLSAQPAGFSPEARAHAQRGVQARQENRLDDAAREFEALIRLAPGLAPAHVNLGLVRHGQSDWEAAVESFQKALAIQADLKEVRGFLGYDLLCPWMTTRAARCARWPTAMAASFSIWPK